MNKDQASIIIVLLAIIAVTLLFRPFNGNTQPTVVEANVFNPFELDQEEWNTVLHAAHDKEVVSLGLMQNYLGANYLIVTLDDGEKLACQYNDLSTLSRACVLYQS